MSIYSHVCVGTNDMNRAVTFYDAAFAPLGVSNLGALGENGTMYGAGKPEFAILKPRNGQPSTHANGGTIGFAANTREAVRQFHAAGVANGGTCEGAPGPREFAPTAYAAYLRDPDGNKICAYSFADGK